MGNHSGFIATDVALFASYSQTHNGTRKLLLITAVAHLPFIHFGSWISISYFLALSQANRKTIKDIQDEALAAAEQRLGRPVSLGESDQPPGNAPGTDTTTADR